jgi:hypothetical protein
VLPKVRLRIVRTLPAKSVGESTTAKYLVQAANRGTGGIASPTRSKLMFDNFWMDAAAVIGVMHVAGPLALHSTFRFAAKIAPSQVRVDELPAAVANCIAPRIGELEQLGFESVGCYDCGELTLQTRTYVSYFCNRRTNDFANVTAVVTPRGVSSYFEFSTRFSNGTVLETNTNKSAPLTPGNPEARVFRFAEIAEPEALYEIHRCLLEKYAGGLWPAGEPKGQEIQRLVRVLENYGPRHEKIGYMALAADGESYRLTWKGAFMMAWRVLWPASLLRRMLERHAMGVERHELEVRGVTALQKA